VELIFGIPMGTKHKHFKEPLNVPLLDFYDLGAVSIFDNSD
jgi:hypothetical protein